jgi:hypothetical protein
MGEARRRSHFGDFTRVVHSESDRVTIGVSQDVEPILEEIAALREFVRPGSTNYHAARLPVTIYEDLKTRGIIDDEDAFRRWLNSSEAAPWRIYQGRL